MNETRGLRSFAGFAVRAMVVHTVTYFLFGAVLSQVFHYERVFQLETVRDFMRPFDSPFVMAGPMLQPLRGLLFAAGIWPLRRFLLEHRRGWAVLWGLFLVFGILGPPAAAPCSMEGVIYSKLPLWYHLMGLPELTLQTLAFSVLLLGWERRATGLARSGRRRPSAPALTEAVRALVAACFAWIGYAAGALLSLRLVRRHVDIERAAGDPRTHWMFVAAFAANLVAVLVYARWWRPRRPPWWGVFLAFWALDTLVPWLYQAVFTHPSRPHLALLLGFFPAVILTLSVRARDRTVAPDRD
jgi:hypothetical protein